MLVVVLLTQIPLLTIDGAVVEPFRYILGIVPVHYISSAFIQLLRVCIGLISLRLQSTDIPVHPADPLHFIRRPLLFTAQFLSVHKKYHRYNIHNTS